MHDVWLIVRCATMALIIQYTCKFKLIRTLIYNLSRITVLGVEGQTDKGESDEPSDKGRNFVLSILGDTVYYFLFYMDWYLT